MMEVTEDQKDGWLIVSGDTYPFKEQLKLFGGRWNPDQKTWRLPVSRKFEVQTLVLFSMDNQIPEKKSTRKCSNCNNPGHNSRTCTYVKAKKANEQSKCASCGRNDHSDEDKLSCPLRQASHPNWKRWHNIDVERQKKLCDNPYGPSEAFRMCFCKNDYLCSACEFLCCPDAYFHCGSSSFDYSCKTCGLKVRKDLEDRYYSHQSQLGEQMILEKKARIANQKMMNYVGD